MGRGFGQFKLYHTQTGKLAQDNNSENIKECE